jgi:radical SAM superfamily enzyme YgiQ (UPF0313 family)
MTANCLLISANRVITPYPVYPLGAACLLGALKAKGHCVSHFDVLADGGLEELARYLSGKCYDLIGVSIRNLDTTDSSAPGDFLQDNIETVKLIRQSLQSPIVLGGPAFSIMPHAFMELLQADYGVVGEGEHLLPWLAGEIANGMPPKKQIFYSGYETNLLQRPVFTKSVARYYTDHGGMLNIQTKRGCPYACSYCSYPSLEGRHLRHRDPEEVADDVIRLGVDFGARYIFFTDSVFNDAQGQYRKIAEALIKLDNDIPWCAFFRPQNLRRDDLRLLKRSGLAAIELGTDAATDTILAGLNKGFCFDDVMEIHQKIVEESIPCAHYVMFGCPDEDEQTLRCGLENIERLEHSVVIAFAGIRILPGTKIFDRAVDDNIIKVDQSLLSPVFYFSPHLSHKHIDKQIRQSFGGRLERIYPCSKFEDRIAMLHNMGYTGPLWDIILRTRIKKVPKVS